MQRFSALSPQARGILCMIASILCFTLMDACAKALSTRLDVSQTLWARYVGQLCIVLVLFGPRLGQIARTRFPKLQLLRATLQLCAAGSFFLSLRYIGLAEATAIADLAPVFVTIGAVLVLGERIGPARVIGVAVALLGALIVIRPGAAVFSTAALLPLVAAMGLAGYGLASRHIGNAEPAQTGLFYSAVFGVIVTSVLVAFRWRMPGGTDLLLMGAIGVAGTCAQFLMLRAYAQAEASVVAPYSYVGLIFATLWGAAFFGEWPDRWTVAGAAIIVGAGLFVWHREARAARRAVTEGRLPSGPR